MNISQHEALVLHDHEPTTDSFKEDVLAGLIQTPKRIPSKFFYDERGSQLFEEITKLDEYYLTRTEISILQRYLPEIASLVGPDALVIEFGTGAGLKTNMLLAALDRPAAYVPIDISREQLLDASLELVEAFPELEVWPVCADYTESFSLPKPNSRTAQTVVFFPGSTVGNFTPDEAVGFLRSVVASVGTGVNLLIGFDRRKETATLEAAYDDRRGVTAAFNLNLISRINREFNATLSADKFRHHAFFNTLESRIEMHLVSIVGQSIQLEDTEIRLSEGEHIVTEYSYKYSREAFAAIIEASGFELVQRWSDSREYFDVWYCRVTT